MGSLRNLLKTDSLKVCADAAEFLPLAVLRVHLAKERISLVNAGFTALTGYEAADFSGGESCWRMLFGEVECARVLDALARQLADAGKVSLQCRLCHKDGGALWVCLQGGVLWSKAEGVYLECAVSPVAHDSAQMTTVEERYAVLSQALQETVFTWELQTEAILFSASFEKVFGYRIPSEETMDFLRQSDFVYEADKPALLEHLYALRAGAAFGQAEFRVKKGARYVWCRSRASARCDAQGRPAWALGILTEIEAYKTADSMLRARACRDETTGLLNKAAFEEAVQKLLRQARAGVLLLLQLDDMKQINAHFGCVFGDRVLTDFARAIATVFTGGALCGRFGGGICTVFLPGFSRAQAEAAIRQFFTHVLQQAEKSGLLLRCHVGAAVCAQSDSFQMLLNRADVALYEAEKQGNPQYILL